MVTVILMFALVSLISFAARNARKLREDGYTIAPLVSLGGFAIAFVIWMFVSPLAQWIDKL